MNSADTVKFTKTFCDSDSPIRVFSELAGNIVEMLSDEKIIKEVVVDLVSSYETQLETAAYRKLESLQRLKNQLSVSPSELNSYGSEWDEIFNQSLDHLEDIAALIKTKRSLPKTIQRFICKVKNSFLPSASLDPNDSNQALGTFKHLVLSLYSRLMSRNFVRSLTIALVEESDPTSSEDAQKLYENILGNLKWLADDLKMYPSNVEKLSFDVLKRHPPKFNISITPKQFDTSTLQQKPLQKHTCDIPTSPFANKITLDRHFRSCCIAGIPEGLNEVVLPIAAAYNSEYSQLIHQLSIVPERGMILHGPPGTGKTVIAQAIASYLGCQETHITVTSGSNLLDKWVGSTEASIRELFRPARKNQNQLHVIIIDEIDAILSTRQHAKNSWERTQVTQFLTELDGLRSPKNVFVIGITNFVEHLDSAALRPGRLGSLIEVPLPNIQQRAQIFELHLSFINQSRLPTSLTHLSQELAKLTEGFSGADIRATVQRTANLVFMETIRSEHFTQNTIITTPGRSITMHDFKAVIDFILKQKNQIQTRDQI